MKKNRIDFKDWELEVDYEVTYETYLSVEFPSAESCGCNTCRNYAAQRENIFPKEIKELFFNLGIDFKKEMEVSHFARLENGLHYYSGWFHFKGSFKGEDCTEPLPGGGYSTKMTPINENFGIGFRYESHLTTFKEKENLVQIEFECKIPWILKNEEEPE